ncbi:hypothetical protein PR048_002728 [Dryococelus australis]|uniref:Uncharacterized protein n=1 Tax=Dryococelus australis TaxID=614101 RepID=A0ABQ9ILP2_9NEOP|nr:hypothetical protein PR048_002728 [Dryococelus australis]
MALNCAASLVNWNNFKLQLLALNPQSSSYMTGLKPLNFNFWDQNPIVCSGCDVVVRLLASQLGKQGSIFSSVAPGFSHVGIVLDGAAGCLVFSGISCFPHPFISALLHAHLTLPSLASLLTASQISSLTHIKPFRGVFSSRNICLGLTGYGLSTLGWLGGCRLVEGLFLSGGESNPKVIRIVNVSCPESAILPRRLPIIGMSAVPGYLATVGAVDGGKVTMKGSLVFRLVVLTLTYFHYRVGPKYSLSRRLTIGNEIQGNGNYAGFGGGFRGSPVDRFLRAREKESSSRPMPGCICNEPKQKMKCQNCGFETVCTIRPALVFQNHGSSAFLNVGEESQARSRTLAVRQPPDCWNRWQPVTKYPLLPHPGT